MSNFACRLFEDASVYLQFIFGICGHGLQFEVVPRAQKSEEKGKAIAV